MLRTHCVSIPALQPGRVLEKLTKSKAAQGNSDSRQQLQETHNTARLALYSKKMRDYSSVLPPLERATGVRLLTPPMGLHNRMQRIRVNNTQYIAMG